MKREKRIGRRASDRPEPEHVLYQPDLMPGDRRTSLEGPEADHAHRSLRVRTGDPIVLVNGTGHRFRGVVASLGKHRLDVDLNHEEVLAVWPSTPVWLAAGVLRSTRMDTLVEKASELGVTRFFPLVMERSVARPDEGGTKLERWRRVAVESLKQCKRSHLMEVAAPVTPEEWLDTLDRQHARRLE